MSGFAIAAHHQASSCNPFDPPAWHLEAISFSVYLPDERRNLGWPQFLLTERLGNSRLSQWSHDRVSRGQRMHAIVAQRGG